MSRLLACALLFALVAVAPLDNAAGLSQKPVLKVGVAAVVLTPFGPHPDWDGTITASGVWGEKFTDTNGNGHWDAGEPFEDDPGNDALDASSKGKYDGIYLAGFGQRRLATAKHDDYWARTIVLEYGATRLAIVALDFVGYYVEGSYYGTRHAQELLDPRLGIQEVIVTSTHNHEGPDTTGIWGASQTSDGKYPKYLRFVDRQIAKSITLAAKSLQPARIKLGTTDPQRSPSIAGMQTRTGGRPPRFFDEEMRVMQFVGRNNRPIATLVNWNTHPESMEDKNTVMTSDFPHAVRETVEKKYGGTALYVSGAIGAAEIIGDTNNKNKDRIRFDGKDYLLSEKSNRPVFTFERTEAIGRDIGQAAIEALEAGEWSRANALAVKKADLKVRIDNVGYLLLARLGVLDTLKLPEGGGGAPESNTTIYALTLGDAQVVTTPGELFPELFYGVAKHRRTDCPAADTGAPPEPSIRDAMTAKYRFMIGLSPDQFGYIVPRYDFRREPVDPEHPQFRQSPDACKAAGVPNHYHETNSASADLAPAVTCVTVALLTGKAPADAACRDAAAYSQYVRGLPAQSP
jgi:hypothetical protein